MDVLIRSLYCYECSLQFDIKYVFDFHLSVMHGKKLEIKQEPGFQAKELVINHPDEENSSNNESKSKYLPKY